MLTAAAAVVVHVTTGTDGWTVLAGVSALLAAIGALATVFFAWRTVRKADETLTAMKQAHNEEMAERRRALGAELSLHRIEQTQGVLETTIELRELAWRVESARDPEANRERLPAVGAKLGASLAGLAAVRGPALEELAQLAREVEGQIRPPVQIVGGADTAIKQIRELFANDAALILHEGDSSPGSR